MTPEETSHLLCASSKAAEAAAHLLLVPDKKDSPEILELVKRSRELLSFAAECGKFPSLYDVGALGNAAQFAKEVQTDAQFMAQEKAKAEQRAAAARQENSPPADKSRRPVSCTNITALTNVFFEAAIYGSPMQFAGDRSKDPQVNAGIRAVLKELGIQAAH